MPDQCVCCCTLPLTELGVMRVREQSRIRGTYPFAYGRKAPTFGAMKPNGGQNVAHRRFPAVRPRRTWFSGSERD